jgi:hypothetical protein
MPIELKRPEVADKFVACIDKDVVVHARGYNGKLSNVNISGAEHIVKTKLGFLKAKETAAAGDTPGEAKAPKRKSNASQNGLEEQQ